MKILFYSFIALSFLSCKKEVEENVISTETIDITNTDTIVHEESFTVDKLQLLANKFKTENDIIKKQVASASPQEANDIYEKLLIKNSAILGDINTLESPLLEEHYTHFSGEKSDIPDEEIIAKNKILNKAGLEIWDIGEGMAEIRPVHDFYLKIFKDHVSPDYLKYLEYTSEEDETLYSADAGIAVTFEEVGRRVLRWEQFLAQYPDSKLKQKAKETYYYYQHDYLFGQDNTSTMEYSTMEIYAENRKEFERFINQNPDSYTSVLVKMVLENTETEFDKFSAKIRAEQEKHLSKI